MNFSYVNDEAQTIITEDRLYEHLRVTCGDDIPEDADLINIYLEAALDYCETKTNIPLRKKTVKMSYENNDPDYGFILRFPTNLEAVESVTYRDTDGTVVSFDKTKCYINNVAIPNEVFFIEDLPSTAKNIIITYKVTAVTNPMAPAGIVSAVLLITGHLYQKRSMTGDPKFMQEIDNILRVYKIRWHH